MNEVARKPQGREKPGRRTAILVIGTTFAILLTAGIIAGKSIRDEAEEWYAFLKHGNWIQVEVYDISDLIDTPPRELAVFTVAEILAESPVASPSVRESPSRISPRELLILVAQRLRTRDVWTELALWNGKIMVRGTAPEQLRVARMLAELRDRQECHGP